jgi:acyl-coenzyme A synthetase/AMP-(fatty) acid ligase
LRAIGLQPEQRVLMLMADTPGLVAVYLAAMRVGAIPVPVSTMLPADALAGVRLAASAGEALPEALYRRWTSHFGIDILDGLGMTEMLHIFLSNQSGRVRAGTTGVAVPGYDLRLLDEAGTRCRTARPARCASGESRRRPATGAGTTRLAGVMLHQPG